MSLIVGIIAGFGLLLLGFTLEEGDIRTLILLAPSVIVFGGTFGAVTVAFSLKDVAKLPKFIAQAAKGEEYDKEKLINFFLKLAQLARTEGLLALENIFGSEEYGKIDPFIEKGIKLMIDGTQPELLKDILETEIYVEDEYKKTGIAMFEAAGGYSPTMGIIGTVMGLVHVLGNLSDPEALAGSIASAFIATLYGVSFANLVFLPVGGKLKLIASRERIVREFMIEGIMSIQAGENPTVLKEKLVGFFSAEEKAAYMSKDKSEDAEK